MAELIFRLQKISRTSIAQWATYFFAILRIYIVLITNARNKNKYSGLVNIICISIASPPFLGKVQPLAKKLAT